MSEVAYFSIHRAEAANGAHGFFLFERDGQRELPASTLAMLDLTTGVAYDIHDQEKLAEYNKRVLELHALNTDPSTAMQFIADKKLRKNEGLYIARERDTKKLVTETKRKAKRKTEKQSRKANRRK